MKRQHVSSNDGGCVRLMLSIRKVGSVRFRRAESAGVRPMLSIRQGCVETLHPEFRITPNGRDADVIW